MKYVFTEAEKKRQRNLLIQLWRFAVLGFKFNKLMKLECSYPPKGKPTSDTKETAAAKHPQQSHG